MNYFIVSIVLFLMGCALHFAAILCVYKDGADESAFWVEKWRTQAIENMDEEGQEPK